MLAGTAVAIFGSRCALGRACAVLSAHKSTGIQAAPLHAAGLGPGASPRMSGDAAQPLPAESFSRKWTALRTTGVGHETSVLHEVLAFEAPDEANAATLWLLCDATTPGGSVGRLTIPGPEGGDGVEVVYSIVRLPAARRGSLYQPNGRHFGDQKPALLAHAALTPEALGTFPLARIIMAQPPAQGICTDVDSDQNEGAANPARLTVARVRGLVQEGLGPLSSSLAEMTAALQRMEGQMKVPAPAASRRPSVAGPTGGTGGEPRVDWFGAPAPAVRGVGFGTAQNTEGVEAASADELQAWTASLDDAARAQGARGGEGSLFGFAQPPASALSRRLAAAPAAHTVAPVGVRGAAGLPAQFRPEPRPANDASASAASGVPAIAPVFPVDPSVAANAPRPEPDGSPVLDLSEILDRTASTQELMVRLLQQTTGVDDEGGEGALLRTGGSFAGVKALQEVERQRLQFRTNPIARYRQGMLVAAADHARPTDVLTVRSWFQANVPLSAPDVGTRERLHFFEWFQTLHRIVEGMMAHDRLRESDAGPILGMIMTGYIFMHQATIGTLTAPSTGLLDTAWDLTLLEPISTAGWDEASSIKDGWSRQSKITPLVGPRLLSACLRAESERTAQYTLLEASEKSEVDRLNAARGKRNTPKKRPDKDAPKDPPKKDTPKK